MVFADTAESIAEDTFRVLRFGVEQLPAVERFARGIGLMRHEELYQHGLRGVNRAANLSTRGVTTRLKCSA